MAQTMKSKENNSSTFNLIFISNLIHGDVHIMMLKYLNGDDQFFGNVEGRSNSTA